MVWALVQKFLNKNARDESAKFSIAESRNIFLYILGIMFYKFALETYLGSISITAADRFPKENAFTLLGALQGLNQACQCVGSILIAPLIAKYPTSKVLCGAIWLLSLMSIAYLLSEAFSGGTLDRAGIFYFSILIIKLSGL